jgi:hypothetical protein
MSSQPHLEIFNPDLRAQNNESGFFLFTKLPTELRLKIWECALEEQRIIRIQLIYHSPEDWIAGSRSADVNGKIHGYPYHAYIEPFRPMNKLLQISEESREVALKFYRVHLPCRFSTEKRRTTALDQWNESIPGTLYYNPEYDFLHISSYTGVTNWIIDFIQEMKITYDPLHVGVCNLAIQNHDLQIWMENNVETDGKTKFLETIANLRKVFFIEYTVQARIIVGLSSDLDVNDHFFNRSLPIMPSIANFHRIGRDPRAIGLDLTRIVFSKSKETH